MSNRFYNFVNQLISGAVAKASDVNAELQGTEVGFVAVEAELNTAIKLPETESATNTRIAASAASRAGKMLGFDISGAPEAKSAFGTDWDMAGFRLRNLIPATESDEPATFGQLSSYAAGLAGLPALVGHTGCLVTDGSTVSWGDAGRNVPSTLTNYGGEFLCSIGGASTWTVVQPNAVRDPNGILGTGWWSTSLTRLDDYRGQGWSHSSPLVTATFDHEPVSAGRIPCGAGVSVVASVNAHTSGVSAGAMYLAIKFYDAGGVYLSTSAATTMAVAAARQYAVNVSTPPATAYIAPVVIFTGVSASSYGIIIRNLKVEAGPAASPFNDFKTLGLAFGGSAQTYWGTGYASPIVTIGDATSTLAALDLRSATGSQTYDCRIQSTGGTNGSVAKGAMYLYSQRVQSQGPIGAVSEYDAGNSGASITIDFGANGQYQKVTLNSATPAITIATTGLPVGKYQLKIVQDATGSRAPTWVGFAAGTCAGNVLPSIASAANAVTFLNLYWDGGSWWVASNPWD